ncbi:YKL100C [Zygosaccharomyces parabailii]|nr:YKL100C [Zygosaccharomyces parabailii]CDH15985.1 uncharacterized protein ZBAI_07773 [Zygosaccharomyces bailii ISA1307]SJM82974.1 uncharacterized protein ZBIST_0764 [Zygosaccharomyces bailii]
MEPISSSQLEQAFSRIPKALSSSGIASRCTFWLAQHPVSNVLVTIATVLAVSGALTSVTSIPHTSLPPTSNDPLFDPTDLELETEEPEMRLDDQDAIIIPICCAVILVALYYSDMLMTILSYAFTAFSVIASTFVYSNLLNTMARLLGKWTSLDPLRVNPRYRLTFADNNRFLHPISWFSPNLNYRENPTGEPWGSESEEPSDVPSVTQLTNAYIRLDMIPSLILSVILVRTSPQVPIIPMNCAIYAITQIQFKNLKSATYVLSALLLYDVYFVFYTPLMTNAAHLDLPIKIQIPTGLIGLGDIVLPGIFISLCYKFDIYKWHLSHPDTEFHLNRRYWGVYATTATVSYVASLSGCFMALKRYQTAQPALLYVVPAQLLPILALSWLKDGSEMWNFHYDESKPPKGLGRSSLIGESVLLLEQDEDYLEDEDSDYVPLTEEEEEEEVWEEEEDQEY